MFAIHYLGAWTKGCFEYLTTDSSGDQPTLDEIHDAKLTAASLTIRLQACQTCMMMEPYPNNADTARLIDEVLQALRDDHGGVLPDEVLRFWDNKRGHHYNDRKLFATLDEKKAMVAIWERWNDRNRIEEQFRPFFEEGDVRYVPPSVQRNWEVRHCLLNWLEKRKRDQVY